MKHDRNVVTPYDEEEHGSSLPALQAKKLADKDGGIEIQSCIGSHSFAV